MSSISTTIPSKNREEWTLLVTGKISHKFQNFVLQLKTAEYSKKIGLGELDTQQAIDDLYNLSLKYAGAVQNDFKIIFKQW